MDLSGLQETAIIKDKSAYSAEFTISEPPSAADNDRLIQDIILQAEALPKKADNKGYTYSTGINTEVAFQFLDTPKTYNDFLSIVRADKTNKQSFSELSSTLAQLLEQTTSPAGQGYEPPKAFPITVVLMPPSSSHAKRSAQPYGT